jgi:hypothetical protein
MAARFGVPIAVLALLAPCSGEAQGSGAGMLTYAYGANWDAARAQRDMLIFEYFSTWRYGDNYVYLETQNLATREGDAATAGSGATTPYGEVHARVSIGKLSGAAVSLGPLQDVLTAYQIDVSQGDVVLLTGAGMTWGLHGRPLLNTDFFVRYDPSLGTMTWQGVAYGEWTFRVGPARVSYGGYAKFVGPEGAVAPFIVSDTRLLWAAFPHARLGLAIRAWRNDSGVRGINEVVPEAIVQWRF